MFLDYLPQFVTLAFIGHRDTLYRLDCNHRFKFAQHIANWFGRLENEGRLDTCFMEKTDIEMLEQILGALEVFSQKRLPRPIVYMRQLSLIKIFTFMEQVPRQKEFTDIPLMRIKNLFSAI